MSVSERKMSPVDARKNKSSLLAPLSIETQQLKREESNDLATDSAASSSKITLMARMNDENQD
jgi:hypothetical protein